MIGDGYVFFSLEQYILRLVIRGFSFSESKCFMDVSGKFRPVCLWNKSTNEITPLIDGTIRIATVVPFSNANNYYSPVRLLHRLVLCYICLLSQNLPWQKWVNRAKIQLIQTYPFQKIYSKFSACKKKLKHFSKNS